ncbi:SDR family oxidoreductase [Planctopirus hydrillae]|uniref:2-deoxy-D-gluconate 3-dehydrogenase n=1 Tax=Planctopirus hydrillae TaxID=1841610 RepID=A0A1C3E441_9PLAN|nr:SDR family NAD(P)-dependent oxidoreductase [Planctopirus hydrillae]ODA28004.1 2-deoxy-D-gluconate 3-dehydrogenase [Planctopirus hydrillae]
MILDLFRLDHKVALITGGSRGLGAAISLALAEAGADIVCVSRTSPTEAHIEKILSLGRRFHFLPCDLSHQVNRAGLVEKARSIAGSIDILVNNAGLTARFPPEEYPLTHLQTMLAVHIEAAFDLAQQVAPSMIQRGSGKIINVGSVMSHQGGWQIPAYAIAKHGLAGLTKSLCNSWAAQGINVNCICPGYMLTELSGSLVNDPVRGPQILSRIPAGRWAQPEELGGLCVFLGSSASNYMHGSIIDIDGGWLAR